MIDDRRWLKSKVTEPAPKEEMRSWVRQSVIVLIKSN